MLAPAGECYNYSGCGNTVNCNHPVVVNFIVDCLRTWVLEYHIDGFRFDLGSVLTRAPSVWTRPRGREGAAADELGDAEQVTADSPSSTSPAASAGPASTQLNPIAEARRSYLEAGGLAVTGTPLADPPLIEAISTDPVLAQTKLIAEAWDCGGLFQVGAFPHYGGRWSEWNGRFRDAARAFLKGATGAAFAPGFAAALAGSPDVFLHPAGEGDWWGAGAGAAWRGGRDATASVNFVTAHDGFSLADLVSYNDKHNELNGEDNRDGESNNLSWNCGEEGPSRVPRVNALRARQARNHLVALLLAQGIPMLTQGDEYGHSKAGNNNTYCHDNELNWLDWDVATRDESGLLRFTKALIKIR